MMFLKTEPGYDYWNIFFSLGRSRLDKFSGCPVWMFRHKSRGELCLTFGMRRSTAADLVREIANG